MVLSLIHNNRSEFKVQFEYLCKSYSIKHKPTIVKNPQANAVLGEHQVLEQMLLTGEIDMAESDTPNDVNIFLDNAAWAISSTYHTVLVASPGAAESVTPDDVNIFLDNAAWAFSST
jgi:hypothetical protein